MLSNEMVKARLQAAHLEASGSGWVETMADHLDRLAADNEALRFGSKCAPEESQ